MSYQPKPTGEWTATTVAVILGKDGHYGLAAAHNAALAAERELRLDIENVNGTLAADLAAEREDHTERMNSVQDFYSRQLADKQKEFVELEQLYRENNQDHYREVGELRRQLAAMKGKP